MEPSDTQNEEQHDGIAIIGMSGRFPGANTIHELWRNVVAGRDCISTFSKETLLAQGLPRELIEDDKFIPRGGRIDRPEFFDAAFFGYSPREAALLDPQHRVFMECAFEALESAGYAGRETNVGVFAGCGMNHYLLQHVIANPRALSRNNEIQMVLGSDKDFLSTRLSFKLNLKGPSLDIQSACSTSLVAVHTACIHLLTYQCDLALAGGAFLQIPWWHGYRVVDGDIRSLDGVCRPFDEKANGTVFGEGAGVVTLKRLSEAMADRDHIYAVIKGSAVNNDGSQKAGYTAPSVEGQSKVVALALGAAGVSPAEVTYLEAHGTGTPLGDPVEVASLTQAFRCHTDGVGYCALGALKSVIGHLDAAAGVAGLIKAVLGLYHKQLPPIAHFETPNRLLDIETSPFYIPSELTEWAVPNGKTRIAGVSSLGVGGTNAHVVLAEAPQMTVEASNRPYHLVTLSAKTADALSDQCRTLARRLEEGGDALISDVAHTLQQRRPAYPHRLSVVVENSDVLKTRLEKRGAQVPDLNSISGTLKRVFMFSGQGAQYVGMGGDLYKSEAVFREALDLCAKHVRKFADFDLIEAIFGAQADPEAIHHTQYTQPILFSVSYAMAMLLAHYGIKPDALIGHSIGEYVAACISGMLSLEDAIFLVSKRGALMQAQQKGAMLSVNADEDALASIMPEGLEIAVMNAPDLTVVSGAAQDIEALKPRLEQEGWAYHPVKTSHAFHSQMMSGALAPFAEAVTSVQLNRPTLPIVSNVTGQYHDAMTIPSSVYFVDHIRKPVRFRAGIEQLLNDGYGEFVEVGPGSTLTSFVKRTVNAWKAKAETTTDSIRTFITLPTRAEEKDGTVQLLETLGRLWENGAEIQFSELYAGEVRNCLPLPTYAFQRKRCWIDREVPVPVGIGITPSLMMQCDDAARPLPEDDQLEGGARSICADTENTTVKIRKVWCDLLGLDRLDASDDFFALGGDSIWAAQMLSRVREITGVPVQLKTLYECPTLAQFSETVEAAQKHGDGEVQDAPVRSEEMSGIPLSSAQLRLWYIAQLEPESPAFNLAAAFEIQGELDEVVTLSSIKRVVDRHDAFRMRFVEAKNRPTIVIAPSCDFDFRSIRVVDSPPNEKETWRNQLKEMALRPYALEKGPLLRVLLIQTAPDRQMLIVMTHHIISDGWSMGVFIRDFKIFYEAIVEGKEPSLASLPFRFADYSRWQHDRSKSRLPESLEFWMKKLVPPLPVLEMPTYKTRQRVLSYRGGAVDFLLSEKLSRKIDELARAEKTTTFTVLLAAYYWVLFKYTGQSDIVIGTPVANRTQTNLENLIGFFLNMVPIRITEEDRDLSFTELVRRIKKTTEEAFSNQETAIEKIAENLKLERDMSHHLIYQTIFAYQNFPMETLSVNDTTIRPCLIDRGACEYDLSLFMWQEKRELKGFLEYSTDLFDEEMMRDFADHFVRFIDSALSANGETVLNRIPLVTLSDGYLKAVNETGIQYPKDKKIHELFEKTAAKMKDKVAVRFGDESITYTELNKRANQLARYLIQKGAADALVGICLDRSIEMIVGMLGILKSGAAYVPLDPYFPSERLTYMVADSGMRLAVTDTVSQSRIDSDSLDLVLLDDEKAAIEKQKSTNIKSTSGSSEDLAYVIYTSGSTGTPKGIEIEQRSVVNFVYSMANTPGVSFEDRVLAVTTLSFDIAVLELLVPMLVGAEIVLLSKDQSLDGGSIAKSLGKYDVTMMQATPSTWRMLLSDGWKGKKNLRALCGGEAFPRDLATQLVGRVSELWNMYGPTETTVWSTCARLDSAGEYIPIGKAIGNTTVYVLDRHLNPVPVGVWGELCIGGDGVARGYHNRLDLTDERFVKDPFMNNGARMYQTGDLVRFRPDMNLEYRGRNDGQVKVRGFRIELGEVETAIAKHPAVAQAAVMVREDRPGDVRLVGYVVMKAGQSATQTDLRRATQETLPDYMVPQLFVMMEEMPLTPNNKIDKKALPSPLGAKIETAKSASPARTPEERYLVELWQELLGIDNVSVDDNFFDLGGHSLLSMDLIVRIQSDTGKRLGPREILMNPLHRIATLFEIRVVTPSTTDQSTPTKTRFSLRETLKDKIKKQTKKYLG